LEKKKTRKKKIVSVGKPKNARNEQRKRGGKSGKKVTSEECAVQEGGAIS